MTDRKVVLADGLTPLPERMLLAHACGDVMFLCGAGISMPAKLPGFRSLVGDVYETLDAGLHAAYALENRRWLAATSNDGEKAKTLAAELADRVDALEPAQQAEWNHFARTQRFDVALGMLERRLDAAPDLASTVRRAVADRLRRDNPKKARQHRALMKLSDRGGALRIATTNYDLLLEAAASRTQHPLRTHSLSALPRPSRRPEFSGVFHLHGALERRKDRYSDILLTDRDFGEYYLQRHAVPDFIHDAARLFNLVLVGYSAEDPPMRYLLDAVAADSTRFSDLRERFAFVSISNDDSEAAVLADWTGRGITPIPYAAGDGHSQLLHTLELWQKLSAPTTGERTAAAMMIRIARTSRANASVDARDLFDFLIRRSNANERERLIEPLQRVRAAFDWLDAIVQIVAESGRETAA